MIQKLKKILRNSKLNFYHYVIKIETQAKNDFSTEKAHVFDEFESGPLESYHNI